MLAPSGGGLILYQAYGNLYAMTECKYDKISYDKAYKDMQQKIERLQAQLGDQKGKSEDTPCVSDTLDPLSQKLENENVELEFQFLGTVRFGNDHVAAILGYGDLQWGNTLIIRRNTCFIRNLEEVDLLKGNCTTNLYTVNLHDMASVSPICLMSLSTKSWLWHQHLSHLNFDTINDLAKNDLSTNLPKFKYHKEHLSPSCEQGKSKKASHPPKPIPNLKQRLHLLHMDLYGPIRVESINGKRVYNRRTKKIMETVSVTFDELLNMDFEQRSSKPRLQSMTSGKIIPLQTETVADNVPNAMFDGDVFENPFAPPSTSVVEPSSLQYVDP
ncbi:retrovirus-related pol polyprotein from transposon TNT 1-94 [Tanacetum coccineum]